MVSESLRGVAGSRLSREVPLMTKPLLSVLALLAAAPTFSADAAAVQESS